MVDRLFQIVYLLIEKQQMTAKELADICEVSERTIYRDIDKLTVAGIPVYTNQGKNGGISLLQDYVLDKTVLTIEEKSKIYEALNAMNEVGFDKDGAVAERFQTFFGETFQDWIEIDFSSWGNSGKDAENFSKIKTAILRHQYMQITYSGNQSSFTHRKIKPLKLCFKDQAWYLYAYCLLREDYRFFKLRRISEMEMLKSHFEAEPIGKVLRDESVYGNQDKQETLVTLAIHPSMAFRAYDELSDISVADNGELICKISVKGSMTENFSGNFSWQDEQNWLISYILSYGSYIQILEPEILREKVTAEIQKMQELYK